MSDRCGCGYKEECYVHCNHSLDECPGEAFAAQPKAPVEEQFLPTSVKTSAPVGDFKSYFEANLLDGDKIGDNGGAMLSADDVYEVLSEYVATHQQDLVGELETAIESIGRKYGIIADRYPAYDEINDNEFRTDLRTLVARERLEAEGNIRFNELERAKHYLAVSIPGQVYYENRLKSLGVKLQSKAALQNPSEEES